jgi:hypothetical protein
MPFCLSTLLPFHLSTYLPTFLPTYLSTYLSTYLPTHLTYLPTYLPTYLLAYLPTHPPSYLPAYLPAYLPTYLPTYLPFSPHHYLGHHLHLTCTATPDAMRFAPRPNVRGSALNQMSQSSSGLLARACRQDGQLFCRGAIQGGMCD